MIRFRKAIYTFLTLFFLCLISVKVFAGSAPAVGVGYFHGGSFHGDSNGLGSKVIEGGIPSSVKDKPTFIDFVLAKYTGSDANYNNCAALDANTAAKITIKNNCIGAAYIIQTMRGPDDTGSWDHSFPNATDIIDWKNKINDSNIKYINNTKRSSNYNTRIGFTAKASFNPYDVFKYSSTVTDEPSIVFTNSVGKDLYVVKRACGNPLGNLVGLKITTNNYNLMPTVDFPDLVSNTIEPGVSFRVVPSITNSGKDTSPSATYTLVKTIVNSVSTGATTSGTDTFSGYDTKNVLDYMETETDKPPGTNICFVLSVKPHSNLDQAAIDSQKSCVVIGKKPKIQVWGGDLLVGGDTDTSVSTKSGKTFGSWVEYAIFATGIIKNTASGAALANQGRAISSACDYSTLSFANTASTGTCSGVDGTIGHYSNYLAAPDVAARFPINSSTPIVPNADLSGLSGVYTANANLTISGGNIAKGKWVVINAPNRDVTITGDINYTSELLRSINDIPQVVIIANNITIRSSVGRIDAWLVAKNGNIYTCDVDPKTVTDCANPLRVNGPVIAGKLHLRRTAGSGSGAASGDPAEVFNLRADAYIWGYRMSVGDGRVQTVYATELPPRL